MGVAQIEILVIAILSSAACALIGSFLVLRSMAMMSDAISHTILLGIVLGFFISKDLASPFLVIGASLMGIVTVFLVESLQKTRLLSEDASIGTIFPLLFSIGIILITMNASSVHLDTDAVLLGELAFAPFDRLIIGGLDVGAKSIYTMGIILLLNTLYVIVLYKELKLVTFDPLLAASLGLLPSLLHYSLMTFVSITTVGAFNAVGAILVVALMIVPASTAFFLVEDLKNMLVTSVFLGILSAALGFFSAFYLDISIAGAMAVMSGLIFSLVFVFSPHKGLITVLRRRKRQKYEFAQMSLFHYLSQGQDVRCEEILDHFSWTISFLEKIIAISIRRGYINEENQIVTINASGKKLLSLKTKEFELIDLKKSRNFL